MRLRLGIFCALLGALSAQTTLGATVDADPGGVSLSLLLDSGETLSAFTLDAPHRLVLDIKGAATPVQVTSAAVSVMARQGWPLRQGAQEKGQRLVFALPSRGGLDLSPTSEPHRWALAPKMTPTTDTASQVTPAPVSTPAATGEATLQSVAGGWRLSVPLRRTGAATPQVQEHWSPTGLTVTLPGASLRGFDRAFPQPVLRARASNQKGGATLTLTLPTLLRHHAVVQEGTLLVHLEKPLLWGKTVVVDAGHGGHDPGALALSGQQHEKDLALQSALTLKQLLQGVGARVVMSRENDVFLELKERTALANTANAHAFVSLHLNSIPWKPEVSGVETYYFSDKARPLAQAIQSQVIAATGQLDRGHRNARFFVVRGTTMPSVLVETGFITNAGDLARLGSAAHRHNLAAGIVNGLETFFGGKPFLRYQGRPFAPPPAPPVIARPTPTPVTPQEARVAILLADAAVGRSPAQPAAVDAAVF